MLYCVKRKRADTDAEFKKLNKNPKWKKAAKMKMPNIQLKEAFFIIGDFHDMDSGSATLTEYGVDFVIPMRMKDEYLKKIADLPNELGGLRIEIKIQG